MNWHPYLSSWTSPVALRGAVAATVLMLTIVLPSAQVSHANAPPPLPKQPEDYAGHAVEGQVMATTWVRTQTSGNVATTTYRSDLQVAKVLKGGAEVKVGQILAVFWGGSVWNGQLPQPVGLRAVAGLVTCEQVQIYLSRGKDAGTFAIADRTHPHRLKPLGPIVVPDSQRPTVRCVRGAPQ